MTINYDALADSSRLLIEAELKPVQGNRFQPTGFPDLGAARYAAPRHNGDGKPQSVEMLLVESPQSVANRMELACWDEGNDRLIDGLQGLSYIQVNRTDGTPLTNSILEAHRINSPYILEGSDKTVYDKLKNEAAGLETGPVKIRDLAKLVFKYDANAVLHGVFLAKGDLAGGRLRMTRCLSGFIEAENVSVAEAGGVKNDRVDPAGDTSRGFGNVPFHRTEFVAERITAYFNLDLSLLRGYAFGNDAAHLLIALSLFKIRRFLSTGLRLRTACDLETTSEPSVNRPTGFAIPSERELLDECRRLIPNCKSAFADPPVTVVKWDGATKKKAKG